MNEPGDKTRGAGQPAEAPEFPSDYLPVTHSADDDEDDRFDAHLCDLDPEQADELCDRLESEGIPCETADAADGGDDAAAKTVAVMVRQADLELARQVARQAPTGDADEDDLRDEAWYLSHWRCPRCHQQSIRMLPPTRKSMRRRRTGYALLLAGPLIAFLNWSELFESLSELIDRLPWWTLIVWMTAVMIVFVSLPERLRACEKCDWRQTESSQSTSGD